MCGEPHGDHDACGVDEHRRHVASHQADREDSARAATADPDSMKEGEHQHAKRGDHEVDPRARFLDEKQTLVRDVPLPRRHRERRTRRDADQLRRGTQDPPEIVRPRIGVVALHAPDDQRHHGHHAEFRLHETTPDCRRRTRSRLTPPNSASAIAHTQTISGSGRSSRRPRDPRLPPEGAAADRRHPRSQPCAGRSPAPR